MQCGKHINEVQGRKNLICQGGIIVFNKIIKEIEKDLDNFAKENPNEKREEITFGVLDYLDKLRKLQKDFADDMGIDENEVLKWLKQNDIIG